DAAGNVSTATFNVVVRSNTPPVLSNVPANISIEATSPAGATVNFAATTATDSFGDKLSVPTTIAPAWSDNFKSYPANSNLIGQGGWTGGAGSSKIVVNGGMIDGQLDADTGKMQTTQHPLPPALINAGTIDLSFDTLAYSRTASGHIRSHNSAVGLGTADSALGAVWTPNTNDPYPVWEFDARGITGNSQAIITLPENVSRQGFDKNVTFHVTVDRKSKLVYGTFDFGNGVSGETARFALTDAQLANLDHVTVMEDYRSSHAYLGSPVMNVAVAYSTAIPAYGTAGVTVSRPSGTVFALGTTPVTVTGHDAAGNTPTATFTVTVRDTTPPVITAPDMVVEATGPKGAIVNFTWVIAKDIADLHPTITSSSPNGSVFALGTTQVTVTAT